MESGRLLSALLFIMISITTAYANEQYCNGTMESPCVVQDTRTNEDGLHHWRYFEMILKKYKGNVLGVKGMQVSASEVPSQAGWQEIKKRIQTETKNNDVNIHIIDLREESHAYLNGNAINLTTNHNWINLMKSHQESVASELAWISELSTLAIPLYVVPHNSFKHQKYDEGSFQKIYNLASEEEEISSLNMTYIRFTVTDHMGPRDEEIDRFVTYFTRLPQDVWIHFHCRGGEGRTTTFMVMSDMLRNADKVVFDEIIKRQASILPFYNLAEIKRSDSALTRYYSLRYDFLKQFYLYAKDRLNGNLKSWSEWKAAHVGVG